MSHLARATESSLLLSMHTADRSCMLPFRFRFYLVFSTIILHELIFCITTICFMRISRLKFGKFEEHLKNKLKAKILKRGKKGIKNL